MYTKTVQIQNETGLHARPASDFVSKAKSFASAITLQKKGTDIQGSAKSVIKVLTMELTRGTEIIITAEGPDEQEAVEALVGLVQTLQE